MVFGSTSVESHPILKIFLNDPWQAFFFILLGVMALLASSSTAAVQDGLDEQLKLARELNATSHWRSGRSILDQLEPELARASIQQRNRYDLTLAHNLALGGAAAAGLELIEQVLNRNPEPDLHLHALWLAANLANAERSYQRGFAYIRDGMAILPEVDDPAARAGLLGVAGMMYAQAGEVEQGVELATQAVNYAAAVPPDYPDSSRCIAGSRLALALQKSTDTDATIRAAGQALKHCQTEENGHFTASLESLIGELHLDQGRLVDAERWLVQAQRRHEEIGYLHGLMLTRLRMMELSLLSGGTAPEADAVNALVSHFRDRRFWDWKAHTHHLAARFAEREGNFSEAVDHLRRETVARERLHAWERSRRMAYLDIHFDMDSRRAELALLQEQTRANALEQTTASQQATLRGMMQTGAGITFALLALLLFRATRERHHFRTLSRQDGLTELLNHTCFFDAADVALNDCITSKKPFTLVVGDIDHFKRVNDCHGHLVGDTVLQRVAGRMRDQFRAPAILGRIGGEEFAIALPGKELDNALRRVEDLRKSINTARSDDQDTRVTMSFGMAQFNGSETIEKLRQRADHALYQAKKNGRDRVVLSDDS